MRVFVRNSRSISQARKNSGIGGVMVELAIALPVLLFIIFGVVEFGWYFVRVQVLARAASVAAQQIGMIGAGYTQNDANINGTGVIHFGTGSDFICAQAYQSIGSAEIAAQAKPGCGSSTWELTTCADTGIACTSPYFALISGKISGSGVTRLVARFLPQQMIHNVVAPVGPISGGGGTVPTSCATGQSLTWNGTRFVCQNPPSGLIGGACVFVGVINPSRPMNNYSCWGNVPTATESSFGQTATHPVGTCPQGYRAISNSNLFMCVST